MATLMITGSKLGSMMGRRRAFAVGLIIYGAGSLTTAFAPNLAVLLIGWSFLEGVGAALIMPAIVALVATNFPAQKRPAAYGLVRCRRRDGPWAVGPLIGGAATTFASWRYVFVGEVVIVVLILLVLSKVVDVPPSKSRLDYVGSILSVVGLGMIVFGVLRSSEWGWVQAKPDGPQLVGLSPVVWLLIAGLLVVYGVLRWEGRLAAAGKEPLLDPAMLRNRELSGGLSMFFAQFLVQAGVFFAVPLFLSVVLELSALETGVRILPLSAALVLAAIGIPKLRAYREPAARGPSRIVGHDLRHLDARGGHGPRSRRGGRDDPHAVHGFRLGLSVFTARSGYRVGGPGRPQVPRSAGCRTLPRTWAPHWEPR